MWRLLTFNNDIENSKTECYNEIEFIKRREIKMVELTSAAKALWGKKTVHNDQELWLPLVAHLVDTKNVMQWLYEEWIGEGTKAIVRQNMTDEDAKKLVGFLGFFHDFGKATPAFQYKQSFPRHKDLDADIVENLTRAGFSLIRTDNRFFQRSPHPIAGEALLEFFGLNQSLGSIIGGHHGIPPQKDLSEIQFESYTSNIWGKDRDLKIQNEWKNVQKNIFQFGMSLCEYHDVKEMPDVNLNQAVILEGMLIMSDWLASSEYLNDSANIPLFPLISLDDDFDNLNMKDRYQKAINNWDLSDQWFPEEIMSVDKQYRLRFEFKPRPLQKEMSELISNAHDPGLIIIEAPTGIGKTELALTAAEQLAFKQGKTGLYMGLPTQATTNAMFTRVEKWLKNIAKEQQINPDIKLLQGKASFNKEYTSLQSTEHIYDNYYDDQEGNVVVNSWFSGKKSILSHFAVGTIDNLLLTALKQKHLFLRHLGFSNKVVIIDELHAYDSYMNSYLVKTIKWLGAYHVPVIALSATLPKVRRNDLLKAYLEGKYGCTKIEAYHDWKNNEGYPLISILGGNKLEQSNKFSTSNDEKRNINIIRFKGNEEEIINKALLEIENGGVAGIIVNTVKRAQDLARLVPEDTEALLLHSSFLSSDRENLEQELQKNVGKGAKRPKKMIVIGTQVLEQSLDIDFDVLFTDIAPIDLLIQRIGRLHRHNISRPPKLSTPTAYITGINSYGDYGKGNEYIYEKYLLMKTDHFLNGQLKVPEDVSHLVQDVYSTDTDSKIKDISEAKGKFNNHLLKSKQKAEIFQICDPKSPAQKNLFGWLNDIKTNVENDIHASACVRDIKETLEVVLLKKIDEEYFLLNGENIKEVTSEKIAGQAIRLPFAIIENASGHDKIDSTIRDLERGMQQLHTKWKNNIWLRGVLVLELDEQNTANLNGFLLKYSSKLGLIYEKE